MYMQISVVRYTISKCSIDYRTVLHPSTVENLWLFHYFGVGLLFCSKFLVVPSVAVLAAFDALAVFMYNE